METNGFINLPFPIPLYEERPALNDAQRAYIKHLLEIKLRACEESEEYEECARILKELQEL